MDYNEFLIRLMETHDCSMGQAIIKDLEHNEIDANNIYDVTDYLEDRCYRDMDMVGFLSSVLSGTGSDYSLNKA